MSALVIVIWLSQLSTSDGWMQDDLLEIPCSDTEHIISDTSKTVVFADCGNGVFNLTTTFDISMLSDLHITGDGASVIECDNVGINFKNITHLSLENLVIRFDPDSNGSIHIMNCTDITITNVTIENSKVVGLVLENNAGKIFIENCTFQNNGQANRGQSKLTYSKYRNLQKLNGGAGLRLLVGGNINCNSVLIQNCKFLNNTAFSGGGMLIFVQPKTTNTIITIHNSSFTNNKCRTGGGGLLVGYTAAENKADTVAVMNNSITAKDCIFQNNEALYGGGTAVFSTSGSFYFSQNKVKFINCFWTKNWAELAMAVDIAIAPWETYTKVGLFPSPVFIDCTFSKHSLSTITRRPKCVLSVTGFQLEFGGNTNFSENNVTALVATSAELKFTVNSNVKFFKNQGANGGAIKLSGLSVIFVQDNSTFTFEKNKADFGGAIYVESYEHSLTPSESCFIQYKSPATEDERYSPNNVFFFYKDNVAGYKESEGCLQEQNYTDHTDPNDCNYRGNSVWATTIAPCLGQCLKSLSTNSYINIPNALSCIGNFSFENPNKRHISTAAHHFRHLNTNYQEDQMCQVFVNFTDNQILIYNNKNYSEEKINPIQNQLHFIPGKVEELPLTLVNELCGEIFFHVSVQALKSDKNSIFVDPAYTVITNNSIVLHGQPGDSGYIQLSTVGVRNIAIPVNATLDECPPGYILHGDVCFCSASFPEDHYHGIWRCDEGKFRAFVRHGYWIGYYKTDTRNLSSAICPKGFCTKITHWLWNGLILQNGTDFAQVLCPEGFCNFSTNQTTEHLLGQNSTADQSEFICHPNREGVICGTCKTHHSAYYRSTSFSCKPDDLCYLGWLFYILTELVPVTILFLVVIFFNISFTSGSLNGVVFFMQVVDTMKLNAENFIRVNSGILSLSRVCKFAYRIFTLSFFAIEEFSFCLWPSASALDMLAFRYITVIYSLFLVIATVFLLKMCICRRQRKVVNLKRSIIHGLSAFIIMSYSECTRLSLLILTKGTVTIGPESKNTYETRAFYNGNYSYMGLEHLKYAIPAIFFILTMVSIPPLLLLSYPLCYKLFALLRIEESRVVQITCKIFPLEKIKPLFDAMQGTFKDRYRFFAGLYLLYRLFALLTFTYTMTFISYYTITGIQLVLMLFLHAVCRPYKKAWHNILDAFLFSNLIIINAMTFYNYQLVATYNSYDTVKKWSGFQAALVFLPLLYLIVYTVYHLVKRIKAACGCTCKATIHKEVDSSNEVIDNLDTRSIEDSLMEMNDYMLLGPESEVN